MEMKTPMARAAEGVDRHRAIGGEKSGTDLKPPYGGGPQPAAGAD